jgi:nucleoside-diphosphate-sugar epimerase
MAKITFLVTGGLGFIGRNLVKFVINWTAKRYKKL